MYMLPSEDRLDLFDRAQDRLHIEQVGNVNDIHVYSIHSDITSNTGEEQVYSIVLCNSCCTSSRPSTISCIVFVSLVIMAKGHELAQQLLTQYYRGDTHSLLFGDHYSLLLDIKG